MKFAIFEGSRREANPGLSGTCPLCGAEVISKCGKYVVWHWAHKGRRHCDAWWEPETEWHRNWKNQFPVEWQEVPSIATSNGERHVADVKTPHGLVIEFQHSRLPNEERVSREDYYGKMLWIVDGLANGLDKDYFNMGLSGPLQDRPLAYQIEWLGRGKLLESWSESKALVYLDFGESVLWRLILYDSSKKMGAVGPIHKATLIEDCIVGNQISVLCRE